MLFQASQIHLMKYCISAEARTNLHLRWITEGTETYLGTNVHSSQISKTHAVFNIIKLGDGVKLERKRHINRKEDGAARGVCLAALTDTTKTMKSDLFYSTCSVKSGFLQLLLVDTYVSCLQEKHLNESIISTQTTLNINRTVLFKNT